MAEYPSTSTTAFKNKPSSLLENTTMSNAAERKALLLAKHETERLKQERRDAEMAAELERLEQQEEEERLAKEAEERRVWEEWEQAERRVQKEQEQTDEGL